MPRVLLAVMPFLPLHRPALGVSALKASCEAAGIACDVIYFTFDYARWIGLDDYTRIDGGLPTQNLTGEWIFSQAAFPGEAGGFDAFERQILHLSPPKFYDADFVRRLSVMGRESPAFVSACADRIDLDVYDIVGLTTTFQQNCASLALARELKRRRPSVTTVLGGGNCDGEMGPEWLRQADWLDLVVSGEADDILPALVQRLRRGEPVDDLSGVSSRQSTAVPARPIHDLDRLPVPDFDEYFAALNSFEKRGLITAELSIETSRGCWWGAKHHCTFCGLNGTGMAYRSKSPERAYSEIKTLTRTWDLNKLFACDNIINPQYFKTVFPRILADGQPIDIQYEMKSNLRREQLRVLRRSGATWFQPGVESLSSHVLQLMDKGVKAIHNVQTLKWAREMGFRVTWNCLCGFPGEAPGDYEEMLLAMRRLTHLTPPASFANFRLDRFSPLFERSQDFGLTSVRAGRAYKHCYPFPPAALDRIAYFFDYDRVMTPETLTAVSAAWRFCDTEWAPQQHASLLTARVSESFVLIDDTRYGWEPRREILMGLERAVLMAADSAQSATSILRIVRERDPLAVAGLADVEAVLSRFMEAGWILQEDGLNLSLPLFSGCADAELGALPTDQVRAVSQLHLTQ